MHERTAPREPALERLLRRFDDAVLVTFAGGRSHPRPPRIAVRDDVTGRLWLATADDAPELRELEANPQVSVIIRGEGRVASLWGRAEIIEDGPPSPDRRRVGLDVVTARCLARSHLALVCVDVEDAELWSERKARAARRIFGAGGASVEPT